MLENTDYTEYIMSSHLFINPINMKTQEQVTSLTDRIEFTIPVLINWGH